MYFLTRITNMFQTLHFTFVECCATTDSEGMKCFPKKIKIMKDVNDGELVLNSFAVVLEVNERGGNFYNAMRDMVEITYRHYFHIHYKNQLNHSQNHSFFVIFHYFYFY